MRVHEELEEQFGELRQAMLKQVSMHAVLAAANTGRARVSERVMSAMAAVPRHHFVPVEMQPFAYFDTPLPIGHDKTISQPYIVALMTDLLDVGPQHRVLDVGTGLGYQAALLAKLAAEVYSIEIIPELAEGARQRFEHARIANVQLTLGDGSRGLPQAAPFDRILVAAAPEMIPIRLLSQLRPGGRMVLPAGIDGAQHLMLVRKDSDGHLHTREVLPVRFSALVEDA